MGVNLVGYKQCFIHMLNRSDKFQESNTVTILVLYFYLSNSTKYVLGNTQHTLKLTAKCQKNYPLKLRLQK